MSTKWRTAFPSKNVRSIESSSQETRFSSVGHERLKQIAGLVKSWQVLQQMLIYPRICPFCEAVSRERSSLSKLKQLFAEK